MGEIWVGIEDSRRCRVIVAFSEVVTDLLHSSAKCNTTRLAIYKAKSRKVDEALHRYAVVG